RIQETVEDVEAFIRLQEDLRNTPTATGKTKGFVNTGEDEDRLLKKKVSIADFMDADTFDAAIMNRHLVVWGQGADLPDGGAALEIAFHTKEQPAFNRQFDLLIRDLKSWETKGFQICLFAENPRQLERL